MITVNIDLSEFTDLLKLEGGLKKAADEAARDLAAMIHGKSVELGGERLRTRRQMFVEGLHYDRADEGVWVVSLAAKVRWIDDGQPEHSMLDALLASPKAKRAKDGSKYIVVPFDRSPGLGKSKLTGAEQDLVNVIKGQMKKRGIPFGSVERNQAGEAKVGKLHSFDIMHAPTKDQEAPGQGAGPVGDVRQGPTGIPLLQGVNVYQSPGDKGRTNRTVLTFRVASDKHSSQARWDHPGTPAVHIMEDATAWAVDTFEKEMLPAIIAKAAIDTSK